MNKKALSNILIAFGLATLLASLVDLAYSLIPLRLVDSNWVYLTSQEIAERSIIPLLGIVFLIAGFYLKNMLYESKLQLNLERALGFFTFIFGIFLIITAIFFTMTLSAVENQVSRSIKDKGESLKKQIAINYVQQQGFKQLSGKLQVPAAMENYFKQIDVKVKEEIKTTKKSLLKKNIKTISNLIAFILAYIYIGLTVIMSANKSLKQINLVKNQA